MAEDIPGFRPYKVIVRSVTRLSPHYARIVFAGEQLVRLGTDGFDQRIKILLPLPDGRWGILISSTKIPSRKVCGISNGKRSMTTTVTLFAPIRFVRRRPTGKNLQSIL